MLTVTGQIPRPSLLKGKPESAVAQGQRRNRLFAPFPLGRGVTRSGSNVQLPMGEARRASSRAPGVVSRPREKARLQSWWLWRARRDGRRTLQQEERVQFPATSLIGIAQYLQAVLAWPLWERGHAARKWLAAQQAATALPPWSWWVSCKAIGEVRPAIGCTGPGPGDGRAPH